MTDNQENPNRYDDLLTGLERLAAGLDAQKSPVSAESVLRQCRSDEARRLRFIRPVVWAAAAAAVIAAVSLATWLASQMPDDSVSRPIRQFASAPLPQEPRTPRRRP